MKTGQKVTAIGKYKSKCCGRLVTLVTGMQFPPCNCDRPFAKPESTEWRFIAV